MKAWTDYPFTFLGDEPFKPAQFREIILISYDGHMYCRIDVDGHITSLKKEFIYSQPSVLDDRYKITHSQLGLLTLVNAKFMITPIQMRMARAALDMSLNQLAYQIGVSTVAISRYERGDEDVMSVDTIARFHKFFSDSGLFFGPKNGVCIGQDAFASEKWFSQACFALLQKNGITPSGRDLLDAHQSIHVDSK